MSSICFKDIKEELFAPEQKIKSFDKYLAHIREGCDNGFIEQEKLKTHIEKVNDYFLKIVEQNGLENVIDKHIKRAAEKFSKKDKAFKFIKLLFFETINFHDMGKINPNFQFDKMKTEEFEKHNSSIGSNHSILSVYLFYSYMVLNIEDYFKDEKDKAIAFVLILIFALVIRKHHSSELTSPFYYFEYLEDKNKNRYFENVKVNDLIEFLNILNINDNEVLYRDLFEGEKSKNLENYFKESFVSSYLKGIDSFTLYSLLKLNSSLLTMADYLATTSFMMREDIQLKGAIDKNLRSKIYNKFYDSKDWNKRLKSNELPKDFPELEKKSNSNLNELRYKMLYEVKQTLKNDIDKNLFFLEAPTGGGKTNISFMVAAELLKARKDLNEIFYVFPFTTLVTQTKESMVETFKLEDNEYIELHSRAEFKDNEENYGKEWKNFIDYQFVNYPITFLTHIRFFDIVKSNRKEDNYLYHKLANSIVVIDEIQAYSPAHWDKVRYFIKKISELFNTLFIIMSATLPKIDQIELNSGVKFSDFVHLNKDKKQYFQNENFSKRVEFEFIDIEKNLKELKKMVKKKAKEFSEDKHWILVEFIIKNSASEFFKLINNDSDFNGYKKYLLSGTILEPVRKRIIKELKENKKEDAYKKVILVSTQVVEAGIDLDFDIGFKDTSIIDSDEQLAGRINRNASKDNCKVFLFDYDKEYQIYGNDYRYKVQKQNFDFDKYKKILEDKNFDKFYWKVFNYINELNKSESRYGFEDYKETVKKLNFYGVHNEFKLIDQETTSVFVNIEFNLEEYEIKSTLGLENEKDSKKFLSGNKVWEKYCEIIENKDRDFQEKRIDLIKIQSLMSNFVFSVFKSVNELKKYGEEKYGFLYIENVKEIYSVNEGLDENKLKEEKIWII